jgi:hypothetical protein
LSKPSQVQTPTEVKLDSLAEKMDELIAWTKFEQMNASLSTLSKELDDSKKLIAYENTTGTSSMQDVADSAGIPKPTVQHWWKQWSRAGIVRPSTNYKGRMQRLVSLADFSLISEEMRPTSKNRPVPTPSTPSLDRVLKDQLPNAPNPAIPENNSSDQESVKSG